MAQGVPFSYTFMDADFNHLYEAEQQTGKVFITFAVFAILIASLGLFGLVTYAAEQRTKEIGIRKVLGANVGGIVALLSKDFVKLGAYRFGDRFPDRLVCDEPMAAEFCLPDRHQLVDLCHRGSCRGADRLGHGQFADYS